jgi:MarR family transcriptional repressor of emrRAB
MCDAYDARVTEPRDARLANLLGALCLAVTDHVGEETLAAAGLDGVAPAALVALLDFSPRGTIEALSQVVGLTHSGTVRLADRLVSAGYVERGPGRDARSRMLTLTPAGGVVAQRVRAARAVALERTVEHLSERQRASLASLCEVLIADATRRRLEQRAAGARPTGGALCRMCDFAACGRDVGSCPAARTAAGIPAAGRTAAPTADGLSAHPGPPPPRS